MMKKLLLAGFIFALIVACSATQSTTIAADKAKPSKGDTIRIANDELQYEVIIIEPGFDAWLASTAKPRNYYSLTYLETKNYLFVTEWNSRVLQPYRYSPDLYGMRIDYEHQIHYGYEVNYLLYNYFVYFQQRYKQKL
jgi:signal peptidase I